MVAALAVQASAPFKARLSPMPIDVSMQRNVAGTGTVTARLVNRELSVSGTFEGLRSDATGAQLHISRVMGVRGPAIAELQASKSVKGSFQGTVALNPDQLESLRKRRLYIQINSESAPDGNLWGWLLQ